MRPEQPRAIDDSHDESWPPAPIALEDPPGVTTDVSGSLARTATALGAGIVSIVLWLYGTGIMNMLALRKLGTPLSAWQHPYAADCSHAMYAALALAIGCITATPWKGRSLLAAAAHVLAVIALLLSAGGVYEVFTHGYWR